MPTLRPAEPSDVEALGHLHTLSARTGYRGILSDDYLDGLLEQRRVAFWRERMSLVNGPNVTIVAVLDGAIVGFVTGTLSEDEAFGSLLDSLHVHPARRKMGIGEALVHAFASLARHAHPREGMYLRTWHKNVTAQRLYERLGGRLARTEEIVGPDGTPLNDYFYTWSAPIALAHAGDVQPLARAPLER